MDSGAAVGASWPRRFGWLYALGALTALLQVGLCLWQGVTAAIPLAGFVVLCAIIRFVPPRLPAMNPLAEQPRARTLSELRPILLYALAYPVILIAPIVWAKAQLLLFFPAWSHDWVYSWNYVVVAKIGLLLVPTLIFALRLGDGGAALGLRGISRPWRWIDAGIAGLLFVASPVLSVVAATSDPQARALPPALVMALFAIALLGAGIPEELFYRVLLQTRLEVALGRWNGLAVGAVLFGLLHLPSRLAFVYLGTTGHLATDALAALAVVITGQGIAGVFLGYLWLRYRNAYVNILAHTAYDGLLFVAALIVGAHVS